MFLTSAQLSAESNDFLDRFLSAVRFQMVHNQQCLRDAVEVWAMETVYSSISIQGNR